MKDITEKIEILLSEENIVKHDDRYVKNSLDKDYMDGPAWYRSGVTKLRKALSSGKKATFKVTDFSDYGGKIVAVVDGEEIPLTKKKLRMRDINTIFGGGVETREKKQTQGASSNTYYSREVNHNDISRVKPKQAADMGEVVKLKNGQRWEYKGISGYDIDNKSRIKGWKRLT